MALRTRLGFGGVTLLAFSDGMFPLQPLILPGGINTLPRELVIIREFVVVVHVTKKQPAWRVATWLGYR